MNTREHRLSKNLFRRMYNVLKLKSNTAFNKYGVGLHIQKHFTVKVGFLSTTRKLVHVDKKSVKGDFLPQLFGLKLNEVLVHDQKIFFFLEE